MSMEETKMKRRLKIKDLADFLAVGEVTICSYSEKTRIKTTMVDVCNNPAYKDRYVDMVSPDYYETIIWID